MVHYYMYIKTNKIKKHRQIDKRFVIKFIAKQTNVSLIKDKCFINNAEVCLDNVQTCIDKQNQIYKKQANKKNKQTNKQTDKSTYKQINKQTNEQTTIIKYITINNFNISTLLNYN